MTTDNDLKKNLFTQPFPLLPLGAFAFIVFCFIIHPLSPLRDFRLYDSDDYMRLNQVINWLSGQSWYDLSHPRLSPGEHVVVYWSRLVDLPLALIAWPLAIFMGLTHAVMMASLIVPPALLGLLLIPAVVRMVRPLVPRNRANLAAVMLIFFPPILINFAPTRVDHHGYQIALAAFGFGCLARIWQCPKASGAAAAAAIAFACGLWVGGEALPNLILFAAGLAFIAAWRGGAALRNAALFGDLLAICSALFLFIARKPSEWMRMEMTWFSLAYVAFAAAIGTVFVVGWFLGRWIQNKYARLFLFGTLSFASAFVFFHFVPKAMLGPYADMEVSSVGIILDHVGEAQPMTALLHLDRYDIAHSLFRASALISSYLFLPVLSLLVIVWQLFASHGKRRGLWALAGLYLLPYLLLALFWQMRVYTYMELFTLLPLTWLLWHWWDKIGDAYDGRQRFWMEIVAFCTLGLFPVVLYPALMTNKPLWPDVLLYPAVRPTRACDLKPVADFLNSDPRFADHPQTLMNMLNEGPELLFRTEHNVLSAPYNVHGNQDSLDFFSARDDDQALAILSRRQVDFVLLCRRYAPFYARIDKKTRFDASLVQDSNGNLNIISDPKHPTLVEKLVRDRTPDWLKPIEIPGNKDYLLYAIAYPNTMEKN